MLKRYSYLFLIPLYIIISATASPAMGTNKINVTIDGNNGKLNGENMVSYINEASIPLDKLYFRLDLNYGFTTKIGEIIDNNKAASVPGEFYKYEFLGKTMEDSTVYQVTFPAPINPKDKSDLTVKFNASGLYKEGEILYLMDSFEETGIGSWYPRVIPFKDSEAQPKEYTSNNYNVKVTAKDDEMVIASSKLLEVRKLENAKREYVFQPAVLRGYDIIAASGLMFEQALSDNTIIKSYYRPKRAKWGKKTLEIAKDIVDFYKKSLGFYPQDSLCIIPGNEKSRGGIVGNNIIVVHDTLDNYNSPDEAEEYLNWFLSVSIAKQYFGSYVGDSNNNPKWLTSGLSLYFSRLYMDNKNFKRTKFNQIINSYIDAANSNIDTSIVQPVDKLNHTGLNWQKIIAEGKSFSVMNMLEFILGKNSMEKVAKQLCQNYANKIISPKEFQSSCEEVSGKNLDWFFKQWFYTSKKLDYGVKNVSLTKENNKTKLSLKLCQLGDATMPVSISITLKNGEKMFKMFDPKTKETELTFQVPSDVKSVSIDEGNRLPDIDRSNNVFDLTKSKR